MPVKTHVPLLIPVIAGAIAGFLGIARLLSFFLTAYPTQSVCTGIQPADAVHKGRIHTKGHEQCGKAHAGHDDTERQAESAEEIPEEDLLPADTVMIVIGDCETRYAASVIVQLVYSNADALSMGTIRIVAAMIMPIMA